MAKHNLVFLLGYVAMARLHTPENKPPYAMAKVVVGRANRATGDHKEHMKLDDPTIMSRDTEIMNEMGSWKQYDLVLIKGVIAAKTIGKASFCKNENCGQKNTLEGSLVYVNPIDVMKIGRRETEDECLAFIAENREISNQAYVFGTLCTDPKKITPKEGLVITQYQIALNRKFHIQADPPEIRTDYPWVKSYGENALSDRRYLHVGSQIFVDGCLQARKVNRHTVCPYCGTKYDWPDRAMEIVPYETEYIANFITKEEADAKEAEQKHSAAQGLLRSLSGYQSGDDVFTEADIKAGISSEEEE